MTPKSLQKLHLLLDTLSEAAHDAGFFDYDMQGSSAKERDAVLKFVDEYGTAQRNVGRREARRVLSREERK